MVYAVFMMWVSAVEAISRPQQTYKVGSTVTVLQLRAGTNEAITPCYMQAGNSAAATRACTASWCKLQKDCPSVSHQRHNMHRRLQGMFFNTLMTVAACSSVVMAYAVLLVLHLQPWWEAQYLIPMLGMILGNTISGISVGLSTVLEELTTGEAGHDDDAAAPVQGDMPRAVGAVSV